MKPCKLYVISLLTTLLLTLAGCIDDAQIVPTVDQSGPAIPQVTQPVEVGVSDTPQQDLAGTSWVMTAVNSRANWSKYI